MINVFYKIQKKYNQLYIINKRIKLRMMSRRFRSTKIHDNIRFFFVYMNILRLGLPPYGKVRGGGDFVSTRSSQIFMLSINVLLQIAVDL